MGDGPKSALCRGEMSGVRPAQFLTAWASCSGSTKATLAFAFQPLDLTSRRQLCQSVKQHISIFVEIVSGVLFKPEKAAVWVASRCVPQHEHARLVRRLGRHMGDHIAGLPFQAERRDNGLGMMP